ncbi:DUF4139 domain-containing protein [Horticoccus luteus]|uniref:DUF4139 domain-containing protein n=2 Tax=Horticoccus luteus TaxID=2862869 RepID=A0A8F9TTC0_9BACT|nr:DUF4139 domain-containing protein [Horticoccus luteus]
MNLNQPLDLKTMLSTALLGATLAAAATAAAAEPALTIYNQNFAVVRETVPLDLKAGVNAVNFAGATRMLEPDSVVLRDPTGKVALSILEQSYRADTLSQGLMLSLHEGKALDFIVRDENGAEHVVSGKVIRSGYAPGGSADAPIIEVDGKLRFSLPGEPIFPALSDAGVLKPTLAWQIESEKAAKVNAELGYVTGGFSWKAAYNFVATEKGDTLDVVGWVTMTNNSGQTFEDAAVKLMAGDVNKIQDEDKVVLSAFEVRAVSKSRMPPPVTEKAFDEFHLYSLARPVTLHDRETKQVEFMRAEHVKAPKAFVYDGQADATKVAIVREFKNTEANGLGLALPKGRTRFYQRDADDGRLEFIGENTIDHTAKNEDVKIEVGKAFDIVGERKQTDQSSSSFQKRSEQGVEIKLRNRKTEAVEVRVVEHLYGPNWKIIEKSDEFKKKDANTIEFTVPVKPDEERTVTYRVRYEW